MPLQIYNTLTRRVEPFTPLVPGKVTMYTCGPTVWNYAHIGNFRTFLFEDLLRRWLESSRYEVLHLMNLTDVDDRIIAEAGKRAISITDFTAPFATAFFEDRDFLRIRPAHEYPRATDFIAPMIELVQGLLRNGTAYQGEDGSVYYAIGRFPAYGRLSQLDKRELKAGASGRVTADEYDKENAQDFVLWKAVKAEDEAVGAAWDAPFGRGRPGWHLECSAMALALLKKHGAGDVLDIHAGGVDLIFPHHEDEIAQSCAFTGEPYFARYWMHGEFLNVRGTKMSKRFGNITTARDLKADGVDAGALRLLVFQTHYRQKLDLTDEALESARKGSRRLGEFAERLRAYSARRPAGPGPLAKTAAEFRLSFAAALDDDLNAPVAVARLFDFVTDGNREMDAGAGGGTAAVDALDWAVGVLDVLPLDGKTRVLSSGAASVLVSEGPLSDTPPSDPGQLEGWAGTLAKARVTAKSRKDYKEADRIRDLLKRHGFEVRDNKDGTVEVRRSEG